MKRICQKCVTALSTSNERDCYHFTLSQEVSVIDMGVLGEIGAEAETTP